MPFHIFLPDHAHPGRVEPLPLGFDRWLAVFSDPTAERVANPLSVFNGFPGSS